MFDLTKGSFFGVGSSSQDEATHRSNANSWPYDRSETYGKDEPRGRIAFRNDDKQSECRPSGDDDSRPCTTTTCCEGTTTPATNIPIAAAWVLARRSPGDMTSSGHPGQFVLDYTTATRSAVGDR
jgi:hypothetical protein